MLDKEKIRWFRKQLDLNPTQFAAAVGVSENTVRRWEIGDRAPNAEHLDNIHKLAEDHGISLAVRANGRKRQPA